MEYNYTCGYLEVIIGPMFSGKTSKLLELFKQCNYCNIPVSVINHIEDTRYHKTLMSSHDKQMIPCIQTATLNEIWEYDLLDTSFNPKSEDHMKLKQANVILINEGQFFHDLDTVVTKMLSEGKHVYVSGLDGDFERKRFGKILDLIPLCDKVTKLTSLCALCKNGVKGIFSLRLSDDKNQKVIGSENYIPVCRCCYMDKSN